MAENVFLSKGFRIVLLRLTLLLIGLASSYGGSLCFKSGNLADMTVGAGAILIGIFSFFFLSKGLWKILGCLTTFVLMAILVGALFFFVSGSDLIHNATNAIKTQFSKTKGNAETAAESPAIVVTPDGVPVEQQPAPQPQQRQMPPITGKITAISSGDVFKIDRYVIRLYGVATPMNGQNCTDANGHSYECGYVSARKLKEFVNGDDVTCRVMNINAAGELMAACSVGAFDIGAAMVQEGWAVALPAVTPIYVPYQNQAQEKRNGLWAGRFQMPWEWQQEQIQQRQAAAAVTVPDIPAPRTAGGKKKKSIFDVF